VHLLVTKNFDIYRNARYYNNKNQGKDFQFRYKPTNEGDINTCSCRNRVRSDVNVSGSVLGFKGIVPKLLARQKIVVR
jgi:hypothetical protein